MSGKYSWVLDALDIKVLGELGMRKSAWLIKNFISQKIQGKEESELLKCALCPNMCEFACPVLEVEGRQTVSPARKSRLASFYLRKNLNASEIGDNLYHCLNCDACKHQCPLDLSVSDLLIPVREMLRDEDAVPEGIKAVEAKLESSGTIYGEMSRGKYDGMKDGTGKILYFRGCVTRNKCPEIIDAVVDLLKSLGGDVQILPDEVCCGEPARNSGLRGAFKDAAGRNAKMLNDSGAEVIVCSCPGCVYALREAYPKHGFKIKPAVMHITEYLDMSIGDDMKLGLADEMDAVYHDPCILARKLGITREPRSVLSRLNNLRLHEPYFGREETYCCGHGGTLKFIDGGLAEAVAKRRVQHLSDYAKVIITSCPSCKSALKKASDNLEVLDIAEVIHQARK